jgi:hypothetical protein
MLIVGLQEVWGLADLEANAAWDPTHHLQSSTVKIRGGGGGENEMINIARIVLGGHC